MACIAIAYSMYHKSDVKWVDFVSYLEHWLHIWVIALSSSGSTAWRMTSHGRKWMLPRHRSWSPSSRNGRIFLRWSSWRRRSTTSKHLVCTIVYHLLRFPAYAGCLRRRKTIDKAASDVILDLGLSKGYHTFRALYHKMDFCFDYPRLPSVNVYHLEGSLRVCVDSVTNFISLCINNGCIIAHFVNSSWPFANLLSVSAVLCHPAFFGLYLSSRSPCHSDTD